MSEWIEISSIIFSAVFFQWKGQKIKILNEENVDENEEEEEKYDDDDEEIWDGSSQFDIVDGVVGGF